MEKICQFFRTNYILANCEEVISKKAFSLNLSHYQMSELPEIIEKCESLMKLFLNQNRLTKVREKGHRKLSILLCVPCLGTFLSGQFVSSTSAGIGLQQSGRVSTLHLRLGSSEIPQHQLQQHWTSASGIGTSHVTGDVLVQQYGTARIAQRDIELRTPTDARSAWESIVITARLNWQSDGTAVADCRGQWADRGAEHFQSIAEVDTPQFEEQSTAKVSTSANDDDQVEIRFP